MPQELLEPPGPLVSQELQAQPAHKVRQERRELQEHRGQQVHKVRRVRRELPGPRA